MRLVQLTRQLGITQNEILQFLKEAGVEITEKGNTKIEQKYVEMITNHFGPKDQEEKEIITEKNEEVTQEQETEVSVNTPKNESAGPPPSAEETKIEVIRAKKIKLEGIKVIGKIELPEKQEKPEKTEEKVEKIEKLKQRTTDNKPGRGKHRSGKTRTKIKHKPKKESYEQKLKREEREARKRRQELEKRKKEKKKKYYQETVKVASPAPQKRRTKKHKPEPIKLKRKITKHKNPVIRIWHWLNGKYD